MFGGREVEKSRNIRMHACRWKTFIYALTDAPANITVSSDGARVARRDSPLCAFNECAAQSAPRESCNPARFRLVFLIVPRVARPLFYSVARTRRMHTRGHVRARVAKYY